MGSGESTLNLEEKAEMKAESFVQASDGWYSSDKLSREIQKFYQTYREGRDSSIAREMIMLREKELDKGKVHYQINISNLLPWSTRMALFAKPEEYVKKPEPIKFYKSTLRETINCLYQYVEAETLETSTDEVYKEREPIEMEFLDARGEFVLSGGSSFSREEALRATHLLASYAKADERFPMLAVVLKEWKTRKFDMFDKSGAFSSYAFMLMLIKYLQAGCSPPVLPYLHEMYPDIFKQDSDVGSLPDLDIKFESENTEELGELLIGFFNFYMAPYFNYRRHKISVRSDRISSEFGQDNWFFIEDPFAKWNIARTDLPYTGPAHCGALISVYRLKDISMILDELFSFVCAHLLTFRDLDKFFNFNFENGVELDCIQRNRLFNSTEAITFQFIKEKLSIFK